MTFFSPVCDQLPDTSHIDRTMKCLYEHIEGVKKVSECMRDLFDPFTKSRTDDVDLCADNEWFLVYLNKFRSQFAIFAKNLSDRTASLVELKKNREELREAFRKYQSSVRDVRNESTKENLDKETASLVTFTEKLIAFNRSNNALRLLIPQFYDSAFVDLVAGVRSCFDENSALFNEYEGKNGLDTEESQIDDLIDKLEKDINSEKTPVVDSEDAK